MFWARLLVYDRLLVISSWSVIVLCGFVTARALVPLPSALFQGQPHVGLGSSEIGSLPHAVAVVHIGQV